MATDLLDSQAVKRIITEIKEDDERGRRAQAKKRHEIYNDGGKRFLVEQIRREFSEDAIKEMRWAPLNLLKKIINKKSNVYKTPPVRTTELPSDQALIDFYVEETEFDQRMLKAHRYFNLFSNVAIYPLPRKGLVEIMVVPSYLYSIVPNKTNQTEVEVWVFNAFTELADIFGSNAFPTASTGVEGYDRNKSIKTVGDKVASNEFTSQEDRNFIFWSSELHFTTDSKGAIITLDPSRDASQFINPIGIAPVTNLTKPRDNEPWAVQGEDLIDLTLAIQSGWTDLLTIAKHQGFSILTVISEEEPKKLTIGVNRAVWLRQKPGSDAVRPEISYVQSTSPLSQYKDLLMDLLALLLSTNDMDPSAVGGTASVKNFTSGFQALLSMADTIEATMCDLPFLRDAERDTWEIIKRWHNWQIDNEILRDDAKALGKFSDEFTIDIQYAPIKPLESETERNAEVIQLFNNSLITKKDAIRRINPNKDEEAIEQIISDIQKEKQANVAMFQANLGGGNAKPSTVSEKEKDKEEKEQEAKRA